MRPSPVMTALIGVFIAAVGVFFLYMSFSHWHADVAKTSLVAGVICLGLSAVSFWGSRKWR